MKIINELLITIKKDRRDFGILFLIWTISICLDILWVSFHNTPPSWDQAFHLNKLFQMSDVLKTFNVFDFDNWLNLLKVTDTYRGPLTYLISSPVVLIFGSTYKVAILSNSLFNGILLISIYCSTRLLNSSKAGLWAAFFCSFSPALVAQRSDYLIDFSLTAILSATWLIFTIWHFNNNKFNPYLSSICGISIALTALVRPTGILFLLIPFVISTIQIILSLLRKSFAPLINLFILFLSFLFFFLPWFSLNWLTILTTLNNARKWGIAYQDGLEANTIEGLIYYPALLPRMLGLVLISSIIILFLISFLTKSNNSQKNIFHIIKTDFIKYSWSFSLIIGSIFICTLMTTKDYRFILPILPQFCMLVAILLCSLNLNFSFNYYSKNFIIFISISTILWNQFGIGLNLSAFPSHIPNTEDKWPLKSIIRYVRQESSNLNSTIAVLPDSKYLNAFNLDAEATSQGKHVYARQIVSNVNNVKNELGNFDWFLIKTGNQGVMSNQVQAILSKILSNSSDFKIVKYWNLPDNSEAYLLRRKLSSINVLNTCFDTKSTSAKISTLPSGLEVTVSGQVDYLKDKYLMLDLKSTDNNIKFDFAIAQSMLNTNDLNPQDCISIKHRFNTKDTRLKPSVKYDASIRLLSRYGEANYIKILEQNSINFEEDSNQNLMVNKINKLLEMGEMFRKGKFDDLFATVAQLNQSDPKQYYLSDAERIFKSRLSDNPTDLRYLYSLSLAQILQKKAYNAYNTLQIINQLEPENENAFLAKAIVQLYRFNPNDSLTIINQIELITERKYILDIAQTIKTIANIMRLDIAKLLASIN